MGPLNAECGASATRDIGSGSESLDEHDWLVNAATGGPMIRNACISNESPTL